MIGVPITLLNLISILMFSKLTIIFSHFDVLVKQPIKNLYLLMLSFFSIKSIAYELNFNFLNFNPEISKYAELFLSLISLLKESSLDVIYPLKFRA